MRPAGILIPLAAICFGLFGVRSVHADVVNGFVEYDTSYSTLNDKPVGAAESKTKVLSLVQRYSLALRQSLYPTLRFSASAILEKDMADATLNGVDSTSNSTQISPNVSLDFGNSFVSSSLGYSRNEQSAQSQGVSAPKNVTDVYSGRLGLRPEGLPTVTLLFSRANSYDADRAIRDVTANSYTLTSSYRPIPTLNLDYQGSLIDSTDRLHAIDGETLTNSLSARYGDQFFNKRVAFFASGNLNDTESSVTTSATGGNIEFLLPRPAAFFALSDTPAFVPRNPNDANTTPPVITWTSTPALIDTNKQLATNPLINLVVPTGGDTRRRNIGLDLADATKVNILYVYLNENLPPAVAALLNTSRWSVYTSSDNENWTLQQNAILPGGVTFAQVFDPLTNALVQRFTIPTIDITTRYIKVVVQPIAQTDVQNIINTQFGGVTPPGFDPNNLLVTEMEAVVSTPAGKGTTQKASAQSGFVNTGAKVSLINRPGQSVFYDVNAGYNFNQATGSNLNYNYFVSNGLSGYQVFNKYLNGSARISLEDQEGSQLAGATALVYGASLEAHFLSTLSNNLTYGGRWTSSGGVISTSDSISLSNTAQLYDGLGVSLAGGLSTAATQGAPSSLSSYLSCGLSATPHRTVTVSISYAGSWSRQTGGGQPDSSNSISSGSVQVTYNPLVSISMFGSVGYSASSSNATIITESFGGSWSPFRDGDLQLGIVYNESITTPTEERTRSVGPNLRWNIRPGWWLTAGYNYQTASSLVDESVLNSFSATLRLSF